MLSIIVFCDEQDPSLIDYVRAYTQSCLFCLMAAWDAFVSETCNSKHNKMKVSAPTARLKRQNTCTWRQQRLRVYISATCWCIVRGPMVVPLFPGVYLRRGFPSTNIIKLRPMMSSLPSIRTSTYIFFFSDFHLSNASPSTNGSIPLFKVYLGNTWHHPTTFVLVFPCY